MVSNEAIAAVANEAAAAINVLNGLLSASGNNEDNGRQESDNGSGEKSGSGGVASPGGKVERSGNGSGSGSTKEDKEIRASLNESGALDDAAKSAELVNNDDKTQKAVNKQVSGKNAVSDILVDREYHKLPVIINTVKAGVRDLMIKSRTPRQQGRLNVKSYIQARENQANIPVFTQRRFNKIHRGKFLIVIDKSGSMAAEAIKNNKDLFKDAVARNLAITLKKELEKLGSVVALHAFGSQYAKDIDAKVGAGSSGLFDNVFTVEKYISSGYTLIVITDAEFEDKWAGRLVKMFMAAKNRRGGILIWFDNDIDEKKVAATTKAFSGVDFIAVSTMKSLRGMFAKITQLLGKYYFS